MIDEERLKKNHTHTHTPSHTHTHTHTDTHPHPNIDMHTHTHLQTYTRYHGRYSNGHWKRTDYTGHGRTIFLAQLRIVLTYMQA